MRSYILMWKKAFNIKGKSKVGEFWWAILFNIIVTNIISMIIVASENSNLFSIIYIYSLVSIIPIFSLTLRRIRDADRSLMNIFWIFLPIIGYVILFVILCSKSKHDQNKEFDKYHW